MSVVFVFGAGASYGDTLRPESDNPAAQPTNNANPPLTTGFFSGNLYASIRYPGNQAEQDFHEVFEYIRDQAAISDPVGEGRWMTLNLEDVFTTVELHREFLSPDSDASGRLVVIRNKLVRYIWRIIATCTQYKYGEHYRQIASFFHEYRDGSVLSFNWDLLFDQELIEIMPTGDMRRGLYHNFEALVLGEYGLSDIVGLPGRQPLFLKMHGSLNWFQCSNSKCPGSSTARILTDTQDCLYRARGIHVGGEILCNRCGSEMSPLLIPPLLRKPINENWIVRAIWGHARQRLSSADKVVIIGFSAAPTDFYAAWLFRSTVGIREGVDVFVVNPQNDPAHPEHNDFRQRMEGIFPRGYNSEFRTLSQIEEILHRVEQIG